MKTHILGAGAMGCLWAAHLHYSYLAQTKPSREPTSISASSKPLGELVFASTRANSQTEYSFTLHTDFLPYIPPHQTISLAIETPGSFSQKLECLLVCTKSYDALKGLEKLSKEIDDETIIILFQNGLGSQYQIIEAFPNNAIYAAVTTEGVNKQSAIDVTHAGSGLTRIGALNQAANTDRALQSLQRHLAIGRQRSGLEIIFLKDIWAALWHKLIINCGINPYTAILDCSNGRVRQNARFTKEWPVLKTELYQLLEIAGYPLSETEIEELVFEVMKKTENNISSMLQDIRQNKASEISDINGFARRFLEQNSCSHSINQVLEHEVKKLEQSTFKS